MMEQSIEFRQLPQSEMKLHPLYLLQQEIKDKSLKKSALESVTTIAIALGRKRTREQLIPFLGKVFVEENNDNKKIILKRLTDLLHPIYIGKPHHSCVILELVMDILCVYPAADIRAEAYECLEKVFAFMDVRKAQNILVGALKKLENEANNDRNIRQLIIRMIPYIYAGVDGDNESELLQILSTYKQNLEDQKLVSETLSQFIKVMPPAPETYVREMIELLLDADDPAILSNLIMPITLLAKVSGQDTTSNYIIKLLRSDHSEVISTAFQKIKDLMQVFSEETLSPLIERISDFENQAQPIKNSIIEILEFLPLTQTDKQKICEVPSSLQLRNTLTDTLCRIQDKEGLVKMFNSVDPNFQLKMFIKLPPICEIHVQMLQQILNGKSWRQKISVLQNLVVRTNNGENSQVLLTKLFDFLGDKIAAVRVSVCNIISIILTSRQIALADYKTKIGRSLQAKNWFQRQSVFRIVQNLRKGGYVENELFIKQICEKGIQDKVDNIKSMARDILKAIQG